MDKWPAHPVIYEINTWVWLYELSRRYQTPITLANVPDAEWDLITACSPDAVWLMGVWERSPRGREIASTNESFLTSCCEALPDFTLDDLVGSPYCVRRYRVDQHLGGPEGLAGARRQLAQRGARLILDLVPNHVAPDHPWVQEHPDYFIQGTPEDFSSAPQAFLPVGDRLLAHGRDPYFPPWPDVIQVNAFAPGYRQALSDTLLELAGQCDGVRCDMAMLLINRIFRQTWGERTGAPAGPGILGSGDSRGQGAISGVLNDRRGLLGPGVGAASAGLRLLLRQAPLRPFAARQRRGRTAAPAGRPELPGQAGALHREP